MRHVGIEGSTLFGQPTGVGQYAKRLTEALGQQESDINFEIIRHWLPFKKLRPPIQPFQHLSYRLVRWFPPAVYFQIFKRLGWFIPYDWIALRGYEAVLFYNFVSFPLSSKTKSVVFIHDLSFVHYSNLLLSKNAKYLTRFVPLSLKRASQIVAVSQSTKNQIVDCYKIAPSKISVIPPAVDTKVFAPRPDDQIKSVMNKYNLSTEKYILFTGTIEPRKNIAGLLEAYSQLPSELTKQYSLVLAGGKGWQDESILSKITELQHQNFKIIQTGYVDDQDLPAVYSGASVFVYPSIYEGFGIPPLEAMACGVPVITSNKASLPEVTGKAALLIKPENPAEIAEAIQKILTDSVLANSLKAKGFDQVKKFSWDKSAQQLIELINELH
ncbi:glycosyltransferase family 4 protein [Candidatus Saccharibacteria bacterium]|nr:glycosyltransferase family 4 protein [Candidatus Saccharibacteria bacterium]